MAKSAKRYKYGDEVEHFTGVAGKITAVTTRGRHKTYEMTYLKDGTLTLVNVEGCEIELPGGKEVGFKAT